MGVNSTFTPPQNTDFSVVISGSDCTPCQTLTESLEMVPEEMLQPGIHNATIGLVRLVSPVSAPSLIISLSRNKLTTR